MGLPHGEPRIMEVGLGSWHLISVIVREFGGQLSFELWDTVIIPMYYHIFPLNFFCFMISELLCETFDFEGIINIAATSDIRLYYSKVSLNAFFFFSAVSLISILRSKQQKMRLHFLQRISWFHSSFCQLSVGFDYCPVKF